MAKKYMPASSTVMYCARTGMISTIERSVNPNDGNIRKMRNKRMTLQKGQRNDNVVSTKSAELLPCLTCTVTQHAPKKQDQALFGRCDGVQAIQNLPNHYHRINVGEEISSKRARA